MDVELEVKDNSKDKILCMDLQYIHKTITKNPYGNYSWMVKNIIETLLTSPVQGFFIYRISYLEELVYMSSILSVIPGDHAEAFKALKLLAEELLEFYKTEADLYKKDVFGMPDEKAIKGFKRRLIRKLKPYQNSLPLDVKRLFCPLGMSFKYWYVSYSIILSVLSLGEVVTKSLNYKERFDVVYRFSTSSSLIGKLSIESVTDTLLHATKADIESLNPIQIEVLEYYTNWDNFQDYVHLDLEEVQSIYEEIEAESKRLFNSLDFVITVEKNNGGITLSVYNVKSTEVKTVTLDKLSEHLDNETKEDERLFKSYNFMVDWEQISEYKELVDHMWKVLLWIDHYKLYSYHPPFRVAKMCMPSEPTKRDYIERIIHLCRRMRSEDTLPSYYWNLIKPK